MLTRRRAALITAALALGACGPRQALKVGFISGQTGPFSDLGAAGLNGAILAVEQRNAQGGVGGHPVKLLIRDDEHNPVKAQAAFHSLLQESVVAVLDPMTSAMASRPELVTFATSARTAGIQMREIRQKDERAWFAASAWAANHLLLETAEHAAEGALVEQYHDVADMSPTYQAFVRAYLQRFKLRPDYAAVIAFDATSIVLDGLSLNPQREGLKQALLNQRRYTGLQVTVELDHHGDASRAAFTTIVKAGQFIPLP